MLRGAKAPTRVQTVSEKEMNMIIANCLGVQLCCIRVTESTQPELLTMEEVENELPRSKEL